MAEKQPEVEPEVVDVNEIPVVETFEPDDEYDEADAPELGDEDEADVAEYEYEKEIMGGEKL